MVDKEASPPDPLSIKAWRGGDKYIVYFVRCPCLENHVKLVDLKNNSSANCEFELF